MITLTEEQRHALAAEEEVPPIVVDPATEERYVLLRSAVYENLRDLLLEDTALSKTRGV